MLRPVKFKAYHGGARKEGMLDFSASLNPYPPEWVNEVFERAKALSNRYLYWDKLEEELSNLIGENVTVTAGITEALYLLGILAIKERRKVVIPKHTYGEYERIARMFNANVIKGPNEPETLAKIVDKESIVFFCNPNNPDGKFYTPKELEPLIQTVEEKNSILVLDEAFIDFVKNAKSPKSENIVRLRTFTKSYGLPGIRVGYVIGFESAFKSVRMPWSIGSLGYAFLESVINDEFKHLEQTMPLIWKEKDRIERILNVQSDANFFIKYVGDAERVAKILEQRGILVRECSSFGLSGYIRFSIRRKEENDILIKSIKSF
ncbi:aminotransferase class I/II-fold pyridoxal phosphate-dependent enzyme [Thermococcus sp. MV5]|uniref:aminotransferase class I/II-fold pyridoxal phosphate-dependent enzyme n=1 Tax=Thermococcus sp. MV5 TaxID=1638272 RepID=UPI00143923FF|nr:aminotransferase class I/II-fold pyridoxal phosphate-dependent enzyme [Thermococcus sp. MV5]NJE26728.1 aminotransferase class I/II-fold pyridoxal phosphate-dependent enzyme [Thermococcus sp. MV5]